MRVLKLLGDFEGCMELKLVRKWHAHGTTIGELFLDGKWQCYTLEDEVREHKIYGETAIPAGTYKVVLSQSKRFRRQLPELLNVPEFTGIRIHPGNTKEDTEGCILVGNTRGVASVGDSRAAFGTLMEKLRVAVSANETITIEVV
jgi:hypothetical protein